MTEDLLRKVHGNFGAAVQTLARNCGGKNCSRRRAGLLRLGITEP
jgi:hypothetical protein